MGYSNVTEDLDKSGFGFGSTETLVNIVLSAVIRLFPITGDHVKSRWQLSRNHLEIFSMSDKYEYDDIDEKAKLFARMELNEVPSQVNDHIERFRKRVKSMPHLHCPTDAKFLMRFLRVSRFDHEKALRRLDNFCTVRSSHRGSPSLFKFFKINDPIVEIYLNLTYYLPLGSTDAGEVITMFRTKYSNLDQFSLLDLTRLTFMTVDVILAQPETQIFGHKWVEDLEGVSMNILEQYQDSDISDKLYIILQDYLPLRLKGQIFFNEPQMFHSFFKRVSPSMKQWLQNATYNFEDTKTGLEKAREIIPGLERILPKEYGGHGGTLKECGERWSKRFKEYYKNGDPLSSIHVDESKRPKETLKYFAEYERCNKAT